MNRLNVKVNKKLRGVYKNCINACSWNKNTKVFRESLLNKINVLTLKINGSYNPKIR